MRVIAISNNKGGTGKTSTAVNLAALLAREGERVVLIDADPQHNSTDFFLDDTQDAPTLYDVLEGTGESVWSDNLQETAFENLAVLPADGNLSRLDLAALLSTGTAREERRLRDFLDAARADGEAGFVVIDCPPGFTAASTAALVCCDEVIVPTRVDAFSRAGVLELLDQVRSLARYGVRPGFRVLVTMADRSRLSKQAEEQLRRDGLVLFKAVIHNSVCVGESSYARLPLYAYAPRSRAALDYEELLKEVLADE